MAQARTEPAMRRASRRREPLVAARPGTAGVFRSLRCALTLARRPGGGLLRFPPLAHPLAIAAALPTPAFPAAVRLPVRLVGTPPPPARSRTPTCRPAVARLRTLGHEELLAAFQQTAPTTRRPARALPKRRSSIMMKLTQGSVNSQRSSPGEDFSSPPGRLFPQAYSLGFLSSTLLTASPGRHSPPSHPAGHPLSWPPLWLNHRPPRTADRGCGADVQAALDRGGDVSHGQDSAGDAADLPQV